MSFENQSLVTGLVAAMAVLVLVQTIFFSLALWKTERGARKATAAAEKMARQLSLALQTTTKLIAKLDRVTNALPSIQTTAFSFLDSFQDRANHANTITAKGIAKTLDQLDTVNRNVEYALATFSRQTSKLRRGIRSPAVNLSAFIHGVTAAFRTLKELKRPPRRHLHDDESFI
jgi:hypothetical protein